MFTSCNDKERFDAIHANITNDLKRTFMNDNESDWSPLCQYAHDDVWSFSSMCEAAFNIFFC